MKKNIFTIKKIEGIVINLKFNSEAIDNDFKSKDI